MAARLRDQSWLSGERSFGIWRILQQSSVYAAVQRALIGDGSGQRWILDSVIQAEAGMRVLDIGCGPANILERLPAVNYVGLDPNPRYLDHAQARYGQRGQFLQGTGEVLSELVGDQVFDRILLLGVLHHLDDAVVSRTLEQAAHRLAPAGWLIAVEPMHAPDSHWIARTLIRLDRGRHVRDRDGYLALFGPSGLSVSLERRDDLIALPYCHALLTAKRSGTHTGSGSAAPGGA